MGTDDETFRGDQRLKVQQSETYMGRVAGNG